MGHFKPNVASEKFLLSENNRLRLALLQISQHGHDVKNDGAYPLKLIAREALNG